GAERPTALRLILTYKFVKAPVLLFLAIWLLRDEQQAVAVGRAVANELLEHGALLTRVGRWLGLHLTARDLHGVAMLAVLDGVSSLVEGLLLLTGKPWAEWVVVGSLSALLPFELAAIVQRASAG